MKKLLLMILCALILNACGNKSESTNSNTPPPASEKNRKKIQPGDTLHFSCPDSFRQTNVQIYAVWNVMDKFWSVTFQEVDSSGNQVRSIENLEGKPDENQTLVMNIRNPDNSIYAIISQAGFADALYRDSSRNLSCTFQ